MAEERKMPYSEDVEQAVLGSVFEQPSVMKTLVDKISIDDFYLVRHKTIYDAYLKLYESQVDIDYQTVINYLESTEKLVEAGNDTYLMNLTDAVPSVESIDSYLNILIDKSLQRAMINASRGFIEDGYTAVDANLYIEEVEKKVFEISKTRRSSEFVTLAQATEEVIKAAEIASQQEGKIIGLDTGFRSLNNFTHGLQPSELIILAARPAMGKSALALNIARNVAGISNDKYVAFFSLEMGSDQLALRLLSAESRVPSNKIRTGRMSAPEWNQVGLAKATLSNLNVYFDDKGTVRVGQLRQKCRKLKQEDRLDLVVIDYLQLLSGSGKNSQQNRVNEVSEISRTLKEMARELKIPVIALSQLSRSVEKRDDKRPIMADLRESGSIEQDADIIMFLYRDDYYRKGKDDDKVVESNTIEISIAKNRQGSTTDPDDPIKLSFDKTCSLFHNYYGQTTSTYRAQETIPPRESHSSTDFMDN